MLDCREVASSIKYPWCVHREHGQGQADLQLHRHASRYPTSSAGEDIRTMLQKIDNRQVRHPRRNSGLGFLARADTNMTAWDLDRLTNMGRKA